MLLPSEDSAKDDIQVQLAKLPILPGDIFVHYKGGTYEVVTLAVQEDTLEILVVYRSLQHGNTVWARTYLDWGSNVDWGGKRVKRFVKKRGKCI